MNEWAITVICIMSMGIAIAACKHGDETEYSFPATLIATIIHAFILYKAGLFSA